MNDKVKNGLDVLGELDKDIDKTDLSGNKKNDNMLLYIIVCVVLAGLLWNLTLTSNLTDEISIIEEKNSTFISVIDHVPLYFYDCVAPVGVMGVYGYRGDNYMKEYNCSLIGMDIAEYPIPDKNRTMDFINAYVTQKEKMIDLR